MKKFIFVVFVFVLSSFLILFLKSDDQNLGDGYYYLSDYEAIDIGYPEGSILYRSNEKNVFNNIKIRGGIVDVDSDSDFIIVQQQKKNSQKFPNKIYQYFIINKKTDSLLGPYKKDDYLQKRKDLHISEKLTISEQ